MTETRDCVVGRLDELPDPGCREFSIGEGDWPFTGFVVRQGERVYAYRNYCKHAGHPLNWQPDQFLTRDKRHIICASHGALYELASGACAGGPCRGATLTRVDVRVEDGTIIVNGPDGVR